DRLVNGRIAILQFSAQITSEQYQTRSPDVEAARWKASLASSVLALSCVHRRQALIAIPRLSSSNLFHRANNIFSASATVLTVCVTPSAISMTTASSQCT